MNEKEFQSEALRAKTMGRLENSDYWAGFLRGLRRGYHGENFGTDEEYKKWWAIADEDDLARQERGKGYRAGLRCAKMGGREYCSQNSFFCETCSLVNYGRDCHNNPVLMIAEV